jgi:hypothetical protein
MDIKSAIIQLSGRTNYNDIHLYECRVQSINKDNQTAEVITINGPEIVLNSVRLTATTGDSSYRIPSIKSIVFVLTTPLTEPFIVLYSELDGENIQTDTEVTITSPKVALNGEDYGGLIKIEDLVEKINTLENALNNLITLYNAHVHISASAGSPTAPTTSTDTDNIQITKKEDIENENIKHGSDNGM